MTLSKYCKTCRKRFERPEGVTNHNWKLRLYCSEPCKHTQTNLNRKKKSSRFKFCPDCNDEKHISQFNRCMTKPDKLQTYCKEHQAQRYLMSKPEKTTTYGNTDLQRDMQKTRKLKSLLSMRW